MTKVVVILFLAGFCSYQLRAQQEDMIGSGRAIAFDGVDDHIDLGNVFDDLTLPVTISVWVNVSKAAGYAFPVFNSQDNLPLYNGVTFLVQPTNISIQYGDGRGENNPAFRRGKAALINDISGRWVNITAVMRGASDMDLFLNGMNMGGFYDGSSTLPIDSDSPGDDAKIGYWLSNGITTRFKGSMDEMRIYNRSLSVEEVRQQMCKRISGDEAGLIGYWSFDETSGNTVMDKSNNQFHGTLIGNPQRVFSGAPIGDESIYLYPDNWSGKTLQKDGLTVSDVSGSPFGVHIYTVNQAPSQSTGLPLSGIQLPYYGVFLAGNGENGAFDFEFTEATCSTFQRNDNSEAIWHSSTTFSQIPRRAEIVRDIQVADFEIDLGPDLQICDVNSLWIEPEGTSDGQLFDWSTGATTKGIAVDKSGTYTVEVRDGCKTARDSVSISFKNRPPAFSLGADEVWCNIEARTLELDFNIDDFAVTWQDGSEGSAFVAKTTGTYWVKVENECGASVDSVTFEMRDLSDLQTYNFISPDTRDDKNQYFVVDERIMGGSLFVFNRWGKNVYSSMSYMNDWDGGELPSGIYFYTLTHECIQPLKGSLTIMR